NDVRQTILCCAKSVVADSRTRISRFRISSAAMIKPIVAVFLIVIGGAVRAEAQDAARTASELGTVARYGDRIWLLDIDGREVRGLFYKISGLDVEVSVTRRGPLVAWSESEIRRIR